MSTTVLQTPFADLEAELAASCIDAFANVIVTRSGGASPFAAILDIHDTEFFGDARGADYQLRYATAHASLRRGDRITVTGSALVPDGATLSVSETPRPTASGHEHIVLLARVLSVSPGQGNGDDGNDGEGS